jgi:REP element-mobilizing transposase RayT
MPRRPRLLFSGAVYHVMARGNRKSVIFHDDMDRVMFLRVIETAVATYNLRIIAYCLMGNHYHVVLETPGANLSDAMQYINGVFAQRLNRRHGQTGHVFEGRFRSLIIQRDSYLVRAARYVVRNPVRAALVEDAGSWRWSSYRATAGLEPAPRWLHLDWIQLAFDADSIGEARQQYVTYVTGSTERRSHVDLNATVLGSKRFTTRILERLYVDHHPQGQLQRHRPTLASIFHGGETPAARDHLIYVARVEYGYYLTEIARFLAIDRSTASKAANRGERLSVQGSVASSLATSSGSSKAGRTNERAWGNARSSSSRSHTTSATNGSISPTEASPRSTI